MANGLLETLLETEEAAKILKVSLRKTESEIANGNLAVVRIGRAVRIRPSALALYIEARESRGAKPKKKTTKAAAGKGGAE